MSNAAPIGFGIVGVGMIAAYHARAIRAASEAHHLHLAGVTGLDAESVRSFAAKHDVPFHATDIDALLARPDVQVVCIATPSGAHLEPALKAIAAGKHVIIEKPIEITVQRADELIAAARARGVQLSAIFQARYGAGARLVKQTLDSGRLGRLSLASAYVKWHRKPEYYRGWKGTLALDGGGAVMNQAIHAVNLLHWFAGMPTEVHGRTTRVVHQGIEAEDTACASFRFPSGALGVLEATTAAFPGWERRIELCGEFGSIALEDDRIVRWDFANEQPDDEAIRARAAQQQAASGAGAPDQINFDGHQRQIVEMADAIRSGVPLPTPVEEARNTVALVCALYESARTGLPVQLSGR
ncbi:Gfo/Idh/MocA family oxidoreductase [Roseateles sp.]|uniref:Gfo/Idh/MocA family protein n=1 Tax=Roseateles sp. TaxID=1971397 RepID=UPI0025EE1502|nr:Gfo/Idh/MocA family oxidoreductase [Roseateles sp.]MBV8037232.1 Gfo/Idh/MocA family oxidoreductase [Roseateles sp.]